MSHMAVLSRPLAKNYVQCTACEHWCALAPGEPGKCGVRQNVNGMLHLLVYGKAVAVHVDPIEKKPLHHFWPGAQILSFGTLGCNLSCWWCQNWDISQHKHADPASGRLGETWLPEQIVQTCLDNHIPLIAFTYNEPAVFFEYAYDTAKLAHQAGLRTVFVSSGFETLRAIDTIAPYLDAINVDLKAFRDQTYRSYCGARLEPIKRNIRHLVTQTNVWTEVTTLVIPRLNDDDDELRAIADFLVEISPDTPWHLSAFHPDYRMQDRPATPATTLQRAREIGRTAGLHFVYTGNIWNNPILAGCSDTTCPQCAAVLIQRQGYRVRQFWRSAGVCPNCGTHIPGIWGGER